MKYIMIISLLLVFTLSSCGSEMTNQKGNDLPEKEMLSKDKEIDIGNYLFNADKMESIEISGKDLLKRKEV